MKVGLLGLLGLVFITLKLCDVIAWSWWLVLLPIYGGAALAFGFLGLAGVLAGVSYALKKVNQKCK